MQIEHRDNGKKGKFLAMQDGIQAGVMTYTWKDENIFVIEHTIGNPDFKGQNVGTKLLDAAVAYARNENKKIIPQCPFARKMFDRREELHDVLA